MMRRIFFPVLVQESNTSLAVTTPPHWPGSADVTGDQRRSTYRRDAALPKTAIHLHGVPRDTNFRATLRVS